LDPGFNLRCDSDTDPSLDLGLDPGLNLRCDPKLLVHGRK
jgi:hypothetical protein